MKPPKILSRSRPGANRGKSADDGLQPRTAANEPAARGESGVWRSGQAAEQQPRPNYGDKPKFAGKPSFGDKPRYGDKPSFGDKPRYGDKPSFGDKPRYGDKPSFGDKPAFGGKPSFGDKPRYGDKPSFGDKARKPFGAGADSRQSDSAYGDKPRRNFDSPAGADAGSFERKPRRDFGAAGGDARPPRRDYESPRPNADAGASPYADKPRRSFANAQDPRPEFSKGPSNAGGGNDASPYGQPRRRFDTFRPEASEAGGGEQFERRPRAPYGAAAATDRGRRSFTSADSNANTETSEPSAYQRKPRAENASSSAAGADERKPRKDFPAKAESYDRPKRFSAPVPSKNVVDEDLDDDIDDGDEDSTPFVDRPAYLAARKAESGGLSGERHPALDARAKEIRIYGRHAVLGVFKTRPDAIRKLYYTRSAQNGLGELLSHLAQVKVSYREVTPEELVKIASSEHHEGVVAEILKPVAPELGELLASLAKAPKASLLLLDGVANPHNFGALLRIAAHFGVDAVLLTPKNDESGASAELPLSGAMYRVAEGGAEATPMLRLVSYDELALIKSAGFEALAAHPHESASIYKQPMPAKVMLMLGAEGAGLSAGLLAHANRRVAIPGSGKVESLNVAQAAAVVLAEIFRQRI